MPPLTRAKLAETATGARVKEPLPFNSRQCAFNHVLVCHSKYSISCVQPSLNFDIKGKNGPIDKGTIFIS